MKIYLNLLFTVSLLSSSTMVQAFNPYKCKPEQLDIKIGKVRQKALLKDARSGQQLKILEELRKNVNQPEVHAVDYLKTKMVVRDLGYKDSILCLNRIKKGAEFILNQRSRLSQKANTPLIDAFNFVLEPMSHALKEPTETEFSSSLADLIGFGLNSGLKSNLLNRELYDIRDRVKQETSKMGISKKLASAMFAQVFSGSSNLLEDYDNLLMAAVEKLRQSKECYDQKKVSEACNAYKEAKVGFLKLTHLQRQIHESLDSIKIDSLMTIPGVTFKDTVDFVARVGKSPDVHTITGLFEKDESKKPINTALLKEQKCDISNFSVVINVGDNFEIPLEEEKILRFFFPDRRFPGAILESRIEKYKDVQLKSLPGRLKGFEDVFKEFTRFYQEVEAQGVFYRDINTLLDDHVKAQNRTVTEDPNFIANRTNNNSIVARFFDMGERLGDFFIETVFTEGIQMDQAFKMKIQEERLRLKEMRKALRLVD